VKYRICVRYQCTSALCLHPPSPQRTRSVPQCRLSSDFPWGGGLSSVLFTPGIPLFTHCVGSPPARTVLLVKYRHVCAFHTLNKTFWEELITYFPLMRHGPHRKRRVKKFWYRYVCICCRGNDSTDPLPSNDKRHTHTDTEINEMDL
jgi:hypothetical protein